MRWRVARLAAGGLLAVLPAPARGQGEAPLPLQRIDHVVIDGQVTEAAWEAITPLPLTMYAPVFRGEATEATEIRLAYDDAYLYASGRFFDSAPDGIRVHSLYRDRWSGDDVFALFVDSFNDNQSARRFTVTPAGTRIDELIGADGTDRNLSWDAPWDAATSRDERGWYVELRIPFATLRFQEQAREVTMGVIATRLIARKNERVTWPAIDPAFRFDQPSRSGDVRLQGIRAARPAYLTPYVLGGASGQVPTGSPGPMRTDGVHEAGLDLKYSLSDNTFVDVSLNTDFAQVEADDQQINLTRFPLFFPEKRQFFQERSDLFLFDFGSGGRLFHSRTIGLSPQRTPVRILGGARIAGRSGDWDFGVLDMQSDREGSLPGENFGAARVKRRLFNPYSYVGAMVTSRWATTGVQAVAAGADAVVRFPGEHYATARWAATGGDGAPDGSLLDRSQVFLQWSRQVDRGLRYWVRLNRSGAAFAPAMGFLPRTDFTHNSLYAVYNSREKPGAIVRTFGPGIIVNSFWRNGDGALESLYAGHWWNYEFWNGASGWLQVTHKRERVETAFPLGDGVVVPAGDHRFTDVWFNYSDGPTRKVRSAVNLRVGSFYDGRQVELILGSFMNLSRHLEIGTEYQGNYVRFPERGEAVDLHVARLRLRAAHDVRLSASGILQYNSVADQLGVNLRLRYNVREGTDLWLVYDQGMNTERDIEGSVERLPFVQSRSLRAKVTYTFGL